MESLVLKCWNGIYGCASFEIIGWQYDFKDILEAGAWYKDIWNYCWIEDTCGNVLYSIPNAEQRQATNIKAWDKILKATKEENNKPKH